MELKYGLRQERAAKKGAKGVDSSAMAMEIGLADIYAKLTEQAWRQWGGGISLTGRGQREGRCADLHSSHYASSTRGLLEAHVHTEEL